MKAIRAYRGVSVIRIQILSYYLKRAGPISPLTTLGMPVDLVTGKDFETLASLNDSVVNSICPGCKRLEFHTDFEAGIGDSLL